MSYSRRRTFSKATQDELYREQNGICPLCNNALQKHRDVDHKIALALGGTNDKSNLQLVDRHCHLLKTKCDRTALKHHPKDKMFYVLREQEKPTKARSKWPTGRKIQTRKMNLTRKAEGQN